MTASDPRVGGDLLDHLLEFAHARRSGVLTIRDGTQLATLTLSAGRLVRVRRIPATDTVGALLVRAGVLETSELHGPVGESLEQLIGRVGQRRGVLHLLVRADDAIAEEMEESTLAVLAHGRGACSFRPDAELVPPRGKVDDDALTLPSGIDVEEILQEARGRGVRFPLAGGVVDESAPRVPPSVIVVDDDQAFLGAVAGVLGRTGVSSTLLSSTKQALEKLPALGAEDVVLADLFMPRASGRGFLGGLELARAAHEQGVAGRVFVSLESPHADAEAQLAHLGAAGMLRRPRGDDPAQMLTFLRPILARVAVGSEDNHGAFDLVRALQAELGDHDWQAAPVRSADSDEAHQLATLKALLGELNAPTFDEEIPLLLLRFASSFFARGALFRVDDGHEEFVGLGGFGFVGDDPGRLVRSIRIPLEAPCLLADAVHARAGLHATWSRRVADEILAERLGAHAGDGVYVAPLLSPRGVEGVLLADNGGSDRRFPDLAVVEIFLQQASAAMERAALARQVAALSQPPRPTTTPASGLPASAGAAPSPARAVVPRTATPTASTLPTTLEPFPPLE
jgi:CheY-like chemotaxis protein